MAAPAMVPMMVPMAEPRYPPRQPPLLSPISPPMAPPTLLPMAAPASTALGSPAAIWLVPHPLRMMVAARIPIKDFFMFISLSLLCWTDCFIKGLFPINHLFGHASVNGDVFAIDEVVLVLT